MSSTGKRRRSQDRSSTPDSDVATSSIPTSTQATRKSKRQCQPRADYVFSLVDSDETDSASSTRKRSRGDSVSFSDASAGYFSQEEHMSDGDDDEDTDPDNSDAQPAFESITISGVVLKPTVIFDAFWKFAAERKAIDDRRRAGESPPWTKDVILQKYFFCNTFRVLDKVSQFIIKEVIEKGSQDPEEITFRVILFNLFTRIGTWQLLERKLGPLTWKTYNHKKYAHVLGTAEAKGQKLYTGAFQKPAPKFGHKKAYLNHLCFLEVLMDNMFFARLLGAPYMADVYEWLASFPSLGSFSSYQLMLSLSYSKVLNFHRDDFVISGPGSLSGLKKIFGSTWRSPVKDYNFHQEVMRYFVDTQEFHFKRLGIKFSGLGPQKLRMDIADIEHTLCEVDKYSRIAFPRATGGNRTQLGRRFDGKPSKDNQKMRRLPRMVLPQAWSDPKRTILKIRPAKLITSDDKRYVIEKIYNHEEREDGRWYRVRWLGYTSKDDTWEPENNLLEETPAAVEEYIERAGISHSSRAVFRPN